MGSPRLNWFPGETNEDPYYANPGWGNGYELPNDSPEQCDDGNNQDGDGWSSTCTQETSYTWSKDSGPAFSYGCQPPCGNGKYLLS